MIRNPALLIEADHRDLTIGGWKGGMRQSNRRDPNGPGTWFQGIVLCSPNAR